MTFLFYTYTHLWMYSGLYSATATFSQPFSCRFSYIHAYIHLWTQSDVSILHLHSSVDVQRFLQCYSYIFAVIFMYVFVHPRLRTFICGRTSTSLFYTYTHLRMYSGLYNATATFSHPLLCTFSYIHAYIHRGPSLALFSKVAKSAWLHFTHQTETSLFSTFSTFYIYI